MKIISVLITILILFTSCQKSEKNTYSVIQYPTSGQPIEISSKIDSVEVSELTMENLRLLRNEFFARHGYVFKSKDLSEYFSKLDWYNPNDNLSDVNSLLSEIELYNIDLIKSIENYKKRQLVKWDSEIQDYLDLIPFIKLPLEFVCEKGFVVPDINYENELIKKYKPEGAAIIGRIYQDKNEVAIIYGYPADIFFPIISRINKEGFEIEEVRIFDLADCVGDAGYEAITYGTITTDFKVKTKKVVYRSHFENEQEIKDSTIVEEVVRIR